MPQRMAILEEDVHEIHGALAEQREVIGAMAKDFSRFTVWAASGIAQLLDSARVTYTLYPETCIPYQRMVRQRAGCFIKKSGSANAKRTTTWFDLLLKSNIDQNEDHILGSSTMAMEKKLKELIKKGVGVEKLKQQYKNDVELEYHVD
ncbi:hypothetical protein Tco_0813802 [Tanacetum coccineum]